MTTHDDRPVATTGTSPRQETSHRIPGPTGVREPLKVNLYERMADASCQLMKLFPYDDAGAIVPCGAIFTGEPDDGRFGHFFHWNTAEEITAVYGASGAMLQTGQIFANQQLHGVNSFLKDPTDPEAFAVVTVTQHQAEGDDQREAVIFRCQKCHEQLLRFEYDATPKGIEGHNPEQWGGTPDDEVGMFPTLWGGVEAVVKHNDLAVRTCSKCAHVNDEFPELKWGWKRWVDQSRTANRSKSAMRASAAALADQNKGA